MLVLACSNFKNEKKYLFMTNTIVKYDVEPLFYLKIDTNLGYEIFINGFPISRNSFVIGQYTVPINNYIVHSGSQEIEINIYPSYNEDGSQESSLGEGYFNVRVEKTEWRGNVLKEPTKIFFYELKGDYFDKTEKIVYDSFKADVPYKLLDFDNLETFREKDSLILSNRLIKKYNNLKQSFENQEGGKYVSMIQKGLLNACQGNYFTQKKADEMFASKQDFIDKKERELEPITNYKLYFSKDKKLISLRRSDGFNMGEGVLRRKFQKNGKALVKIEDVVFCKPVNSDDIQVCWYMNFTKGYGQ